ncbi:MAG: hypothetical protein ACE5E8_10850 [Acidimicrobiia bacterium]
MNAPSDPVVAALENAVARYGETLGEEPRRLRAFLTDMAGEHRAQISSLLTAAEEGIPHALLAAPRGSEETVAARLVETLIRERGLDGKISRWAVDAWARALRLAIGASAVDVSGQAAELPAGADTWIHRGVVVDAESFDGIDSRFATRGEVREEAGSVCLTAAEDRLARMEATGHPISGGKGVITRLTLSRNGVAAVGLAAASADDPLCCLLMRPGAKATLMRRSGGGDTPHYRHSTLDHAVQAGGACDVFWGRLEEMLHVALWDSATATSGTARSLTVSPPATPHECHLYVETVAGEVTVDRMLWLDDVEVAG